MEKINYLRHLMPINAISNPKYFMKTQTKTKYGYIQI